METQQKPAQNLIVGDVLVEAHHRRIVEIHPYVGPFDFIVGVAVLDNGSSLSLIETVTGWTVVA